MHRKRRWVFVPWHFFSLLFLYPFFLLLCLLCLERGEKHKRGKEREREVLQVRVYLAMAARTKGNDKSTKKANATLSKKLSGPGGLVCASVTGQRQMQ